MSGLSACCLSGKVQEGTPVGREENVAGRPTYVSEPEGEAKTKSVVLISDIFGWKSPNTRLLADVYAKAGFYVYVPDFFDGGALPIEFLQDVEPPLKERESITVVQKAAKTAKVGVTLGPFVLKYREAVVKPLIDGFINHVKTTPGTNKVGAIGYCWGGRYAILATHGDGIGAVDAAYTAHPSLLAVPADIEPVSRPLSIAHGGQDSHVSNDSIRQIEEILNKKAPEVATEVKVYPDQVHGFALRGDFSSEKDKEAMDEATQQGISWMEKHLS